MACVHESKSWKKLNYYRLKPVGWRKNRGCGLKSFAHDFGYTKVVTASTRIHFRNVVLPQNGTSCREGCESPCDTFPFRNQSKTKNLKDSPEGEGFKPIARTLKSADRQPQSSAPLESEFGSGAGSPDSSNGSSQDCLLSPSIKHIGLARLIACSPRAIASGWATRPCD